MNPNNCETCDYKNLNKNEKGHCYMFRDEHVDVCYQHTKRNTFKTFKHSINDDLLETYFQLIDIIE